jgi:hypothetical protein
MQSVLVIRRKIKRNAEKRQQNIALRWSDTILWTGLFPPAKVVHYMLKCNAEYTHVMIRDAPLSGAT